MLRKFLLKFTLKTPSKLKINTNELYRRFKRCETKNFPLGKRIKIKYFI